MLMKACDNRDKPQTNLSLSSYRSTVRHLNRRKESCKQTLRQALDLGMLTLIIESSPGTPMHLFMHVLMTAHPYVGV